MTELPWKPVIYLPAELLGPDADRKQVSRLARCLEEYAVHFRGERPLIAAAVVFYPDFHRIPARAMAKELVWIIWPPGSTAIVSMATRWMEPMFSEAGISIADDMANNFRIEPKAGA